MAYVTPNFKTKKDLKAAVARGTTVRVFSPAHFPIVENGECSIEGPHYPQPHTWYARVEVRDGVVTKVK